MPIVLNLTPLTDDTITIVKGDVQVTFPDRLPASLVPVLLAMQHDDGSLNLSYTNVSRIYQIVGRLVSRSNPDWDVDRVMDFLDIQDLVPIVEALLNPQVPSSSFTELPNEEASLMAATPTPRTRSRKPTA